MARFKEYDRSQGLFLTVNLEEQLIPGTFEWTLDYLIDKMDMSLFEKNYNRVVRKLEVSEQLYSLNRDSKKLPSVECR